MMKGLWKLTVIESKLFLRQPTAIFFTLAFPIILLAVFGAIYGNEPSEFFGGHGYIDTVCPAFIGLVMAMTGFTSIPGTVASYRERGVLRRLRASPIRSNTILLAWIMVYTFVTLLSVALMLLFGRIAFGLRFEGAMGSVILFAIISMVSVFSLGFIIASLAPTVRTAETVGMAIYFPMIFLSGATIPVQTMPDTLLKITNILPLTHIVKLMQGLWFGDRWQNYIINIGVIVGLAIVGIFVSAITFRWE
ncbi:MAG: ABC transporter permease [Spirochaetales bacterium]|nr:ABC transporter permease [Spirochaetales bacterium]